MTSLRIQTRIDYLALLKLMYLSRESILLRQSKGWFQVAGVVCGMASIGMRPVFELQFVDFVASAWNQITQNLTTLRWRTGGQWTCLGVLYAPYGAYLPGSSQANESWFDHTPGVRVVIPSTPEDAAGLIFTAMRAADLTIVLLPKHQVRQPFAFAVHAVAVPFGKARVRRQGADLPIDNGGSGDPYPVTAYSVFCGISAVVAYQEGRQYDPQASLSGKIVAVQGLGHVSMHLCCYLSKKAGASLIVADIFPENVDLAWQEFRATAVDAENIYDADADVFSPCALGGGLNSETIPRLKYSVVAGSANNQLASPEVVTIMHIVLRRLHDQWWRHFNITYAKPKYDKAGAFRATETIGDTLFDILTKFSSCQSSCYRSC